MEEVKTAKLRRANIKRQLTVFVKFINGIDQLNINELIKLQIQNRLEKIEPLWQEFDNVQSTIEILDGEEIDHSVRDIFENSYNEIVPMAKHLVQPKMTQSAPLPNVHQNLGNVKLPTINLPSFDGAYENWLQFHDAFNALIHENLCLKPIQKFYYLQSCLKGEAAKVLQSLEVSESNNDVAWEMLQERLKNTRLIVNNHVKALFNVNSMHKESHSSLRQILDTVVRHLRCLKTLKQPVDHWDTLIIHIVTTKLDNVSRREWEGIKTVGELPTWVELAEFLKNKCELLETLEYSKIENKRFDIKSKRDPIVTNSYLTTNKVTCVYCSKDHSIYKCESFVKLPVNDRLGEVRKLNLCIICLRKNHFARDCRSSRCRKCSRGHNTLLHFENKLVESSSADQELPSTSYSNATYNLNSISQVEKFATSEISITNHSLNDESSQILLSTACILVEDIYGTKHNCRVLLDSGSQSNFITKELCERLGLEKTTVNFSVAGINQTVARATQKSLVKIYSRYNAYNTTLSCLVLPKITENVPIISFDCSKLNIPENIRLADSQFNITGKIDMLLGSGIFYELLSVGQVRLGKDLPILHKTQFGWVISGNMNHANATTNKVTSYCSIQSNNSIDNQLQKFWQLEECNNQYSKFTREEQECEEHFIQTTKHANDGRFVVSMPLKQNFWKLGSSRNIALKRFYALERKLDKDINLKREYTNFMQEYVNLNHMSKIKENLSIEELAYYLPHHAVVKESSLTTKVCVVFDGSAKTDTGLSLNDVQMVGPTIQNDLFSIILRFRKHAYVITADIAKMYRQVVVTNEDRKFQRIFWRSDNTKELECFELNTVTYGTASAPFLAIRCLQQLAIENESKYSEASKVIQNDFYVDDLLTGADSRQRVVKLQRDINTVLRSAGFNLRKWLSNDESILEDFQGSQPEDNILNICDNQITKTLGILWNAKLDTFQYSISKLAQQRPVTKRTILANTAQIFDPLGLLGPIIINAKLLIQKLWQHKLSWDESIPIDLHTQWLKFSNQLDVLNKIKVPRHVVGENPVSLELHGFADSSERAYGACIYIRSIDKEGKCTVNLVCAKSKVAPLRSVTLPRLELCGAILLARLCQNVVNAMSINFKNIFYWCDSTIVLSWIRAEPKRWTTFVANRVAEIQNTTELEKWRHVRSEDNPADLISRGVTPHHLIESKLWWHGLSWLSNTEGHWASKQTVNETILDRLLETRNTTINLPTTINDFGLLAKYSSLSTLERVYAYCRRFLHNSLNGKQNRRFGHLNVKELQEARFNLIKIAQKQTFDSEISNLVKGKALHSKSRILSLNPFLDNNSVLRVGGRLEQSKFEFDKKHPIILPPSHPLSKLIATNEHIRLLHCGPQALLASLRERYWPIYGRNLAKKVVHDCVTCFRSKPKSNPYIMGGLPETRVAPATPFYTTGVDYAGPFFIRDRKSRNYELIKSYVCLFICFATKAIHLELVCDLTTDAFLASFRRFVSRRGRPQKVYSDNGTNFIGANTELKDLSKFLVNEVNKNHIIDSLVKDNISWQFIPPRSPHFGGLWEAGIKSTKTHLKKVIGNAYLTFEEMYTVLTQIEAVLNSRPLCPMSTDPDDLTPITPAHFLIGRTLTSLPDPDLTQIAENRLSRYQRLQQLTQHFWKRWNKEYISSLQPRVKWRHPSSNTLKVGSLVILREENLPPLKWQLGRIIDLHPGSDGVVRVISVKVSNGVFKRSVAKVCVLPID